MHPASRAGLGVALAVGLTLAAAAAPAAARTSGKESFRGQIIAPAKSGARHVVSTMVVAKGVFRGDGKLVEVENRPGDPDNVTRDDLVFPQGTIHIRNASRGAPEFTVDPQTCTVTGRVKQTTKIQGGTRMFRHASGTLSGQVRGWSVAARNPDGSCNQQADALLEADAFSGRGTMSF
jgi:hypothetical protein